MYIWMMDQYYKHNKLKRRVGYTLSLKINCLAMVVVVNDSMGSYDVSETVLV